MLLEHPRTGPILYETIVRTNIKIAESQGQGVPVVHFDPECHGAQAHRELAREVLRRAGEEVPGDAVAEAAEPAENPFAAAAAEAEAEQAASTQDEFTRRISRWWEEAGDGPDRSGKKAASGA